MLPYSTSPLEPLPLTAPSLESTPLPPHRNTHTDSIFPVARFPTSPCPSPRLPHSTMGSSGWGQVEVIRGLDKEKGARIPESCGSQATEPRDRAPGCLSIGRVPARFRYMKICFCCLLPVPLELTLIVSVLFVMELVWGRQWSVEVGMMEGLWQRPLRGREEEREMGFGSAKLSLNQKRVFICFVCFFFILAT